MTQNEMILNHMQKCNGITSMEAYSLYGCTRLSARIKDLEGARTANGGRREIDREGIPDAGVEDRRQD